MTSIYLQPPCKAGEARAHRQLARRRSPEGAALCGVGAERVLSVKRVKQGGKPIVVAVAV